MIDDHCPEGSAAASVSGSRMGPRGCIFSGFAAPGDVRAAFGVIPNSAHLEILFLMIKDAKKCQL